MSNLTTRAGKGSPLTNNELDANFTNLNADKVEIGGDLSGTSSAPNVAKIQGRAVSADAPAIGEKLVWNGTAWEPSADPTNEPIGHEDKSSSSISFNSGTRTFTISPVAANFVVWCKGVKYTYTSAQAVVIPDTTGLHFIYFNASGVLSTQMSYFTWEEHAPTAYVYWNATTQQAVYFGDERHGITLDWQTHEYLHRTRGAAIASGFGASGYTTTGAGATDADAQIDIGGGTFFDEDLQVDIVSTNTPVAGSWQQDLSGPARIPVLYLSGSAWVVDAPTNFPFKVVSGVPQYNLYSGGSWSTAPVTNNEYFVSWILATHNLTYPVIAVISQAPTNQLSAAEAMTFEGLNLNGFPSVEFRPLYKVIYQYKSGFTNSVKASTIAVYDIRSIAAAGVAAALVQDHGNLSGLGDDDHAQYLHVSEVRSPSTAVKNSFLPSQTSQSGKYLTTDGSNPSWGSIPSGSLTFTGDVTGSGTTGSSTTLTLSNSGASAGTYTKVTVDAKGRVTTGASINSSDITTALGFTPENSGNKGVANGYASLDGSGKVPSVQLPSYVDDVLEYANLAAFPGTGETGKIYIAIDTAKTYRWSGSAYVEISASPGSTDAVPEGSTNLYFTNSRARGAITATGSLSYNNQTGVLSYTQPTNVSTFTNDSGYLTGITGTQVTNALGYTPPQSNGTGASGTWGISITGNAATVSSITSGQVTTALGYTPYNSTNPNGYITSASLTWANISAKPIESAVFDASVNSATYWTVVRPNGSAIANPYVYRITLVTTGTGTDTGEVFLLSNVDSLGWVVKTVSRDASGSNRPYVFLDGGVPKVKNDHPSLYNTRIMVEEFNAVSTGGLPTVFGLEGNFSHDQGTPKYRATWNGSDNTLLHSGNYSSYSPTLTGTGASGTWGINISGNAATATSATDSTKLPLSGGTLTGDLTLNGNNTYFGGNVYLRANSDFNFLTNSGSAQNGRFRGIQVSSSYSGAVPENGILFGTDTTLVRGASTYGSLLVGGARNGYWGTMYDTGQGNAGWMTNGNASGYYAHGHGWKYYHESGVFYIHGGTYGGGAVYTALHSGNYTSYAPSLTGSGASGTWGISVTGSAGSVGWANVSSGTRTGHGDIRFQPPASSYAGIQFLDTSGNHAAWMLLRGTSDVDVYTAEGLTIVADKGWLTLAQRDTAGKGVRLMSGVTSTERLKITAAGDIQFVNGNSFTYGGNAILHAGNYGSYALPLSGGTISGTLTINGGSSQPLNLITSSGSPWGFGLTRSDANVSSKIFLHNGSGSWAWVYEHNPVFYNGGAYSPFLHSGNYSSYALPLSGGTMTGSLTVSGNGSGLYFTGGNNRIYFGGSYRAMEGNGNGTQLQIGEGYSATYLQSANNYATTSNHLILHAGNYNSYSPTLTGGGASGTWGINITGNANTASLAIWSNQYNFSTAGAGWYRVATTGSDGRGTYNVELYCTGGSHNPALLQICAQGDWGYDKIVYANWDGSFPASAVRITRGASNTFLEVYFTVAIAGATLRINRSGFDTSITPYTGSLPAGGDTVKDTLDITAKINASTLSVSNSATAIRLASGHHIGMGDWGLRNTTPYGWIQFGPANSSWCHIYGSQAFYFNQDLYTNGAIQLHSSNYSSYALPLSGGTLTGVVNAVDFRSQGQIRATGWYNTNSGTHTGLGTEIGVSGGSSYILSYNRDTGSYGTLEFNAANIKLVPINGSLTGPSGNVIVHAGNYSSYALPLSGGTLTGDFAAPNISIGGQGRSARSAFGGNIGATAGSWNNAQLELKNTDAGTVALAFHRAGYTSDTFEVRDASGMRLNGNFLLHAGNYTSYSPSLTGSGASGTWGINITGNAATVGSRSPGGSAGNLAYYDSSNSYLYAPTWIGIGSGSGIFSTSGTNGAHWHPTGATFGVWNISGSKGGYSGISCSGTSHNLNWMVDMGGNLQGWYNQSYGWQMYWSGGTLSVFKNSYGGGTQATVLDSSNYSSYTFPLGGGWYGSGLPGSRAYGVSVSGGEFVLGNGLPNAGQIGVLIDGCYVAGENNGFWSLASDNTWGSRRGMYWDGSFLNFSTNTPNLRAQSLYCEDGGGIFWGPSVSWSSFIRGQNHPDQGYSGSTQRYWVEIGSYGGTHVTLNMDGAAGSGENGFDHFTIWQAAANSTSGSRQFYVTNIGNVWARNNITAYSDERVKSDWSCLRDDFVSALAKVRHGTYTRTDYGVRQAGVSAQSIRELLPEVVTEDSEGMLSVAYGNAAMVSAVELAKELVMLKKELAEIKSRLH